jgi:hypothetical protein
VYLGPRYREPVCALVMYHLVYLQAEIEATFSTLLQFIHTVPVRSVRYGTVLKDNASNGSKQVAPY